MTSASEDFDPHAYNGPLDVLSRRELSAYLEAHNHGSPAFIEGMEELAERVGGTGGKGSSRDFKNGPNKKRPDTETRAGGQNGHSASSVRGPRGLSWQAPLPLVGGERPGPLPTGAYPDWIQDFVESLAGFVQVARDLPALLVLAMLSGALQKNAVVQVRPGWTEPLSLWGAAVLASGERKSPAYRKLTKPVEEHERELRKSLESAHLQAKDKKEVLEARLKEAKKEAAKASDSEEEKEAEKKVRKARETLEEHEVPPLPQLWIDDATSEALLQLLSQNHERMLAMSPEGDLFKYMSGRYIDGGDVLNLYKKAWTGSEAVRDNRVTREDSAVSNPALSVGICAQPQVLEDLAQKRTFRGEGILARFLYVVPKPKAGTRLTGREVPPLDQAAQARYEKKLKGLLEMEPKVDPRRRLRSLYLAPK